LYKGKEVDRIKEQLGFYFIYDGVISEEDNFLSSSAIKEASVSFPGYQVYSYINRVDMPVKISSCGRRTAYMRKEIKF
jgi:hypothetical protein